MATPTDDTYSAASGATIYAGRSAPSSGLPSWVPALGTVADVSTNTADSIKGTLDVHGLTRAWSGMAFAPWWGTYGRAVSGGGGHGDGAQNWLVGYDIENRAFYLERGSCAVFHASDNYVGDATTGWMWADTGGVNVQVGEPFTSHFYGFQIALPPSAISGSTNGWLFTPGRGSLAEGGQRSTGQSHKYPLGSGGAWTMHGTPLLRGPTHGPSVYDTKRNRVLSFGDNNASAQQVFPYVDLTTQAVGTITTGYVYGFYMMGGYHTAADCYLLARFVGGTLTFNVIDPVTLAMTTPVPTGTPPTETAEGAWDWVDSWNSWVYYPGDGGNNVYTLKCTGDPRGNNWVWGVQTVTGTARSRFFDANGGGVPYNRLRFVPALGTLLWIPDYLLPAQMFHISAP